MVDLQRAPWVAPRKLRPQRMQVAVDLRGDALVISLPSPIARQLPAAIAGVQVSAFGHDLPVFLLDGQQLAKRVDDNKVNLPIGRAAGLGPSPMHAVVDGVTVAQAISQALERARLARTKVIGMGGIKV